LNYNEKFSRIILNEAEENFYVEHLAEECIYKPIYYMQEYNKTKEEENKSIFQTKDVSLLNFRLILGTFLNCVTLVALFSQHELSTTQLRVVSRNIFRNI